MPVLAARPKPFDLFYETKSNLKREQLELLAHAAVLNTGPAWSMHDEILRLMDKGSTALTNVQLLQHAREFGVRVISNSWSAFRVKRTNGLRRCSSGCRSFTICSRPTEWRRCATTASAPASRNATSYRAARTYRGVYPLAAEEVEKLAYFFEDRTDQELPESRRLQTPPPGLARPFERMVGAILVAFATDPIDVRDIRRAVDPGYPPWATARRHLLQGRPASYCWSAEPHAATPKPMPI